MEMNAQKTLEKKILDLEAIIARYEKALNETTDREEIKIILQFITSRSNVLNMLLTEKRDERNRIEQQLKQGIIFY